MSKLRLLALTFCIGVTAVTWVRFLNARPYSELHVFRVKLEPRPEPLEQPPENTTLADKHSQYLCDHLADLKEMAWTPHDHSGDAIYDALERKRFDAVPCLIDKITDMHHAENPTGAPFWAGLTYRVGDTAVLMMMDINDMYWPRGMVTPKYERMFTDQGMSYYYFYVDEVPGARKHIQLWWRNWLKTCQPKCAIVHSLETE